MPNQPAIARADVVIAGGGFAGLALALALRQGLGASFKVVVADPAFAANARPDLRASAIAAAARRMFETLGVWDAVADDAQPILDMVVTNSKLKDAVRPVFLTFAGRGRSRRAVRPHDRERAAQCGARREGARAGDRVARDHRDAFRASGRADRSGARRRNGDFCVAAGRGRRRALGRARAGRHRDAWMVLRAVGDRHDGRA